MWWNKDGLTSGGAECAPVRVFLVPSFCVFMCRFAIRGCGTAGICVPFGVRRRGCYCWQWFLALALFRRRNACHQCAWLLEKLGLWRGRGIYPPWCGLRGGAGGVPGAPVGGEGALLGYSWQPFVPPTLCCDLLCLRCYKKLRMPSIRRLRAYASSRFTASVTFLSTRSLISWTLSNSQASSSKVNGDSSLAFFSLLMGFPDCVGGRGWASFHVSSGVPFGFIWGCSGD